jgi:hypothetical protein
MTSLAIVDSGPLVAVANAADPDHRACLEVLQRPDLHLVIPALCVAEAAYFIQRRQGPRMEARFLAGLAAFEIHTPGGEQWKRVAELVETYADFPLGAADAAVIVAAEQLHTDLLVTLDRRHFGAVRPEHCDAFRIRPG